MAILQNNWPLFFRVIKVMRETVWGTHRLEESKQTWQLNAVCDPGLDSRLEKKVVGHWRIRLLKEFE